MTTSLKMILATAAIAALASPVAAQGLVTRAYITNPAPSISNAHGSVGGARRKLEAPVAEQNQRSPFMAKSNPVHDCVTPALASCM